MGGRAPSKVMKEPPLVKTRLQCNDRIDSLEGNAPVTAAKQMCDASKSKPLCNLCDDDHAKEAIYICIECPTGKLCNEHLKLHNRLGRCDKRNLLTIQEYLDKGVCHQDYQVPLDMCPEHKAEKLRLACTNCHHPLCLVCQAVKICPTCGPMPSRDDVEELGKSTEKLNHKLDELISSNKNTTKQATDLIKQFQSIKENLKDSCKEAQQSIDDLYHKMVECTAKCTKDLKEQTTKETAKEIKQIQESIDTLNQFMSECELARSKAALARTAPPVEMAQIFSDVKAQLEASCSKVKVEQPREMSYVTPSDEELESTVSRLIGFFRQQRHNVITEARESKYDVEEQLQHKVITKPRESVTGVCDAVYSEYRRSTFISCSNSGLYEAGAGGERKVDGLYSCGLCLSVCGKKLYSTSNGREVHVFDLTEESDELRPIQTITVPGHWFIYSVSVSTGGRVAVNDYGSVSVLTQDGVREVQIEEDDAVFGGSDPVSVQWVGEQSLCVVLGDGRVMLISLDPVDTVWTTKLTKPNIVSSAGGRLYVSHDDNNRLTVLDERGGAAVGVITCPGEEPLKACALQNGTIATVSYNR